MFFKFNPPISREEIGDTGATDAGSFSITGWSTVGMGLAAMGLAFIDLPFRDRMINLTIGVLIGLAGTLLLAARRIAARKSPKDSSDEQF